jgi:hypothetical protein
VAPPLPFLAADLARGRRLAACGCAAFRGAGLPTICVTEALRATGGFSGRAGSSATTATAEPTITAPAKAPAAAQDSLRGVFVGAASLALGSPSSAAQWAMPP